jgi:hypothetical protein
MKQKDEIGTNRLIFLLLGAAAVSGCSHHVGSLISAISMEKLPDETPWHRRIDVGHGVRADFEFEKTKKGNGVLTFPGGFVRNYDAHNDCITFDPFGLNTRLVDLDHDGYLDLDVSGVAIEWDEKVDREKSRRLVQTTFRFNPSTRTFTKAISDPWIYTE